MPAAKNNSEDTIVAVSTPIGEGGIGIVRLSGPKALRIADEIFVSGDNRKPSKFNTYTVHYGHIVDKGKIIDEVILTVMKAPGSYTREDIVEINCHGGLQATKEALELTIKSGARVAEPGEFTKRAFLNGRLDLAQAEAVLDVIRAKTEGSLKAAVSQLEGGLSKEIDSLLTDVLDIASQVEAGIDFPEEALEIEDKKALIEKTEGILKKLKALIDSYSEGMVLREGVLVIICGRPNTGKSSLMNLLLKRDRVIVSPIPGTTRDAVEELINLKGVPVRLVDTAGIAPGKDPLEKESVRRSKRYLDLADIAVLMLDGSEEISPEDRDIINLVRGKKKIVVINKSDLPDRIGSKAIVELFRDCKVVDISVEKKANIELLEKYMLEMVWSGRYLQGESAIVTNARHKELLDKSMSNMLSVKSSIGSDESAEIIAIDLKEAAHNIGLITGKSISEDILDRIFEQFCIGK